MRLTLACKQTLSEEPYAGNPHVRFCGGAALATGRPTRSHDDDVAENILTIVRNGILAYEEHTGFEINTEMVKYEK